MHIFMKVLKVLKVGGVGKFKSVNIPNDYFVISRMSYLYY